MSRSVHSVCSTKVDLNVELTDVQLNERSNKISNIVENIFFRHFPRKKYLETSYLAVQTCIYLCVMASL